MIHKSHGWPQNGSDFLSAARHLVAALPHGSDQLLAPHSISLVMEVISDNVMIASGAAIDQMLLQDHIAPLCQLLEPTDFLAMTITRCTIMEEVIGKTLATTVRRHCIQEDWNLELPDLDTNHKLQSVRREFLETRGQLVRMKTYIVNDQPVRALELCGKSMLISLAKPRTDSFKAEKAMRTKRGVFDAAMMIAKPMLQGPR